MPTEWYSFTYESCQRKARGGLMILTRFNAKSHVGLPIEVTDRYIVLANGSDTDILYYDSFPSSTKFTVIKPPFIMSFGVGEHRLPLGD